MKRKHDEGYTPVRMKTSSELLERLAAPGKYGFFPANTIGDDVELHTNNSRGTILLLSSAGKTGRQRAVDR
jgi:cobalamin-dependent methionine synthase I